MRVRSLKKRSFQVEQLEARHLLAANLQISEFVASNSDSLLDGDGESPDWIEIENAGDSDADLDGWYLTDDEEDLQKWPFPAQQLGAGQRLVVFASAPMDALGRVVSDYVDPAGHLHTSFQLRSEGEYLALVDGRGGEPIVVSEFASDEGGFPKQRTDISYGLGQLGDGHSFVTPQSSAKILVPSQDVSIAWQGGAPFDDTQWSNAQAAIGFDLDANGGQTFVEYNRYEADSAAATTSSWPDESGGSNWTMVGATVVDVVSENTSITHAYTLPDSGTGVGGDTAPFPAGDVTYELWVRPGDLDSAHQVLFETGGGQNGTAILMTESAVRLLNSSGNSRTADLTVPLDLIDTSDFVQIAAVLDSTAGQFRLHVRGSAGGTAMASANGTVGRGGNRASLFTWGSGLGNLGNPADAAGGTFNLGGRTESVGEGVTPVGLTQFRGEIARLTVYNGALEQDDVDHAFDSMAGSPTVDFTPYIQSDVEAQMHETNATVLVRVPFDVPADSGFDELALKVRYDDGFIAYLNGVEVARRNGPAGQSTFNAQASSERSDAEAVVIERIDLSDHVGQLSIGPNVLAFQVLNAEAADRDLLLEPELTASIGSDSQTLYFTEPTPGAANDTTGYLGFVADTKFDFERGYYNDPIDVQISSATPDAQIYFTTDGHAPTQTSGTLYSGAVPVTTTTTLRAAAYLDNYIPTNVDTHTYLFLNDVVAQPNNPVGYPATWAGIPADYEMDPDVVGPENLFDDLYRDTIVDDLKSLPALSIVMDPQALFGAQGIYINPQATGDAWERPTSAELIIPDGSEPGFQIDSGIRVQGGSSRNVNFPKHSIRLEFRSRYGDSRLNYPLFSNQPFSDSAIDTFDEIVLRASFNNSWTHWHFDQAELAQQQRDQWARDIQEAMNQPTTHGRFVHLYLNGMYWGIYNMGERPAAPYQSDYFGGGEDDWDVLNGEGSVIAVDGDKVAWNAMWAIANSGLADQSNYEEILEFVDVENLADYIIMNFYFGNEDWDGHNWMAARQRSSAGRWRFFAWDSEFAIGLRPSNHATGENAQNQIINIDRTALNTGGKVTALHQRFATNEEYRLLFADRLQKHFFNNGVLTPEVITETWNARARQLDRAIVAESARWGDYRRDVHSNQWPATNFQLYTYEDHYLPIQDFILNEYFPVRSDIALRQMAARGLFPGVAAPTFQINGSDQHGGVVSFDDLLSMSGGTLVMTTETSLVTIDGAAKAFVPVDASLESGPGPRWHDRDFDDSTWITGSNGVGYDIGSAYDSLINTDVIDAWNANPSSAYARFEFDLGVDFDAADVDGLEVRMKYDDGYVVYLNGQLVHSQNAPTPAEWNSRATGKRLDLLNTVPSIVETTDLSEFLDLLTPGNNVLAIHALNHADDLDDLLARPELVLIDNEDIQAPVYYTLDGSDPRETGGAVVGLAYADSISLADTTEVNARALHNGEWSALSTATFVVEDVRSHLAITEINYNPHGPTMAESLAMPGVDNDRFEFLELTNTSASTSVSLLGMQLIDGVAFEFGDESLSPGESAVVVDDVAAFQLRYGDTIRILGQWTGGLSAGGERLQLADATDHVLIDITYEDAVPWAERADGAGATLELIDWTGTPADRLSKSSSWRGSTDFGGSPGKLGTEPLPVVINEVLSRTEPPATLLDSVELHNTSNQAVDIGGWYLSDAAGSLLKYEVPAGTILGPNEYIVFDESHFNPTPLSPAPNDFALSGSRGDDVWLVVPNDTGVRYFVDDVHFGGALNGVSFGRVDGAGDRLAPQSSISLGCANRHPSTGPLIVSEVHYAPGNPTATALAIDPTLTAGDLEFVEILNPTTESVDLKNWRVRGGVDLDFDEGTLIDAGQALVLVRFNPENPANADRARAFREHHGINESVMLFGGYQGGLSNEGERVTLLRPDQPPLDDPTFTPYVIEDEVLYDNLLPWPTLGDGQSINRISPVFFGNISTSWTPSAATPGTAEFTAGLAGDFSGDGVVDADDIGLLDAMIRRASTTTAYDLDASGTVDLADRDHLIREILGTFPGDANLDGRVNASDLNVVGVHWLQTGHCLGWSSGDFSSDQLVDATDLNVLGLNWLAGDEVAAARPPRAPLARQVAVLDASFASLESKPLPFIQGGTLSDLDVLPKATSDIVFKERSRWKHLVNRRDDFSSLVAEENARRDDTNHEGLDLVWTFWRL